jgi:hypothetical protein
VLQFLQGVNRIAESQDLVFSLQSEHRTQRAQDKFFVIHQRDRGCWLSGFHFEIPASSCDILSRRAS